MFAYLQDFADTLRRWNLQRRTINVLERLDDHMLHDVGVDRFQIAAVAARRSRDRVARERVERDRRARERVEQREFEQRQAVHQSPLFSPALDRNHAVAWNREPNKSRIPSVVDDIALGAAFRGEPCHAC